ncbi:VWA domain-containing protein [Actinoplanes sp. NPDC049316]|uniref:VWA domain-containing protein n=1 Tax=Actinoplanes sp. NPDC049316 TaxID=3154727 RepID=UPI00342FF895
MTGRHRRHLPSAARFAAIVAGALAVAGVVVGVRAGVGRVDAADCATPVRLTVAAPQEIASAVRASAAEWARTKAAGKKGCIAVDVQARSAPEVAAAVSREQRVTLAGVGTAQAAAVPDVWVADSASWLLRLRTAAPAFAFTEDGSLAQSPVVVAMPEPIAKELGWPRKQLTYADLLTAMTTDTSVRPGTVDPSRDAAALSGLLALDAAAATQPRADAAGAVLRALATDASTLREDLMAQLPQSDDPGTLAGSLGLAVMPEYDVVAYNSDQPAVPLTALYLTPSPAPLDYPFAVLPGADPAHADAAHRLYEHLTQSPAFRERLGVAGLRSADGTIPTGLQTPTGAPRATPPPADGGSAAAPKVDDAAINRTLAAWSAVVAPARALAVVDASKSMSTPVPSARNATRMQVSLAAAKGGLKLFGDDWQLGLWMSAAGLDTNGNHRELVPVRPLRDNRGAVAAALGSIRPSGGDGALYRTIVDGYRQLRDGWQPGRVNSLIVLTDGVGDEEITLPDLLRQLQGLRTQDRPVQIIIVGLGDAVDRQPLEQITDTTGGGVFVAEDPAQIEAVFLQALSLRTATPR